jgi:hypothetical protein
METEIDQLIARRIIDSVGSSGIPPEYGFQYFTVGLDELTEVIDRDYFQQLIKAGGSSFKLIVGTFGTGKTHLLYILRELAWKNNFATSYVVLKPEETPFHKLDLVYREIANNLQPPLSPKEAMSGTEKGIESFIIRWFNTQFDSNKTILGTADDGEIKEVLEHYVNNNIKGYESSSFTYAVRNAFKALLENNTETFEIILPWLKGESYSKEHKNYGILQKLDQTTAFPRLRSLGQWIRSIGFSGLVILFDEAEVVASFRSRQMELLLNNLRQLIDTCQSTSFQGFMIFYAVPSEDFMQQRGEVYNALRQRLATYFSTINPSGVKINLETLFGENEAEIKDHCKQIGLKLSKIYTRAYDCEFDERKLDHALDVVIDKVFTDSFFEPGFKRRLVQRFVSMFHFMRNDPSKEITEDIVNKI